MSAILGRYSKLPISSTNYRAFIGYGGETGQRIAEDLCGCLPLYGVYALAITPNIRDAAPYLESEEYILRLLAYGDFDAAIMVCTHRAFRSTRFRDEAEKAIYDLKMPTIAFVPRRSPVLEILKRRTMVRFERSNHLIECEKLANTLKALVDLRRGVTVRSQ